MRTREKSTKKLWRVSNLRRKETGRERRRQRKGEPEATGHNAGKSGGKRRIPTEDSSPNIPMVLNPAPKEQVQKGTKGLAGVGAEGHADAGGRVGRVRVVRMSMTAVRAATTHGLATGMRAQRRWKLREGCLARERTLKCLPVMLHRCHRTKKRTERRGEGAQREQEQENGKVIRMMFPTAVTTTMMVPGAFLHHTMWTIMTVATIMTIKTMAILDGITRTMPPPMTLAPLLLSAVILHPLRAVEPVGPVEASENETGKKINGAPTTKNSTSQLTFLPLR